MFKIAAAVIDFYDDPTLGEEAGLFNGGPLLPPDRTSSLRDVDFAVKIATAAGEHRKFPIYNRESTALSGAYFDKIAGELPENIRDVAGYYLKEAHAKHALELPEALQRDFEDPDGRTVGLLAEAPAGGLSVCGDMLKIAQEVFVDRSRQMTPIEKVAKAVDISKAAEIAGEPVTEREVYDYTPKDKYGPFLRDGLEQREILVRENEILKEAFASTLQEFVKTDCREGPFLIFHFDKIAGLDLRYKDGIMDPFYMAWGGLPVVEKKADAAELLNYKLGTIARQGVLLSILGEDATAEFTRHPIGAYERWKADKPAFAAVVDELLEKIPTEVEEAREKVLPRGKLGQKVNAAQKTMKAPGDRPSPDIPGPGVEMKLDVGL